MRDVDGSSERPAGEAELAGEIASAARCAALLEEAGLGIAYVWDVRGRIEIELRRESGERLRTLSAAELFELLAADAAEQAAWVDCAMEAASSV